MIYQPTNVAPSMLGEIGNGTVDVTYGIPVSWQVNGNSPLEGFQIDIFTNDEYSVPRYSTGLRTGNCPFYPKDENGNAQIISYTIPREEIQPEQTRIAYVALTTAFTVTGIDAVKFMSYTGGSATITYTNGQWKRQDHSTFDRLQAGIAISGAPNEGDMIVARNAEIGNGENLKLQITQFWGNGKKTAQTSESAFITRLTPTFGIDSFPNPVTTKQYTFSADYFQAQGDALNWIRWQIAYADDIENPIYDTGTIFGATNLQTTFDGFLDGYSYSIRCRIQTQNGVSMDSGWTAFQAAISAPFINGFAEAKCKKGVSGVLVSWETAAIIPGTATGEYHIEDNDWLVLESGKIIWNRLNGAPFSFENPWAFAWSGKLRYFDVVIYELGQLGTERITLTYRSQERELVLAKGETVLASVSGIAPSAHISTLLTETKFYVYYHNYSGGLYPAATLYPNTEVFPQESTAGALVANGISVSYTQASVTSVTLNALQKCDYVQLFKGEPSDEMYNAFSGGEYVPSFDESTYILADFSNGLNAGNLPIGSLTVTGISIYREENGLLKLIAKTDVSAQSIIDYGAKSQGGAYRYFVYLTGTDTYAAQPLVTNYVSPCWWDWAIIECTGADNLFTAVREYHFGKNLTSGTISNNNAPTVQKTFTRYPNIQLSPVNYASGTLQSLIGVIDQYGNYSDTVESRNAIFELSATPNTLFLKDRKGDLWRIRISGAITAQTNDNSRAQEQTISIPWAQCGNAENCGITRIESTALEV